MSFLRLLTALDSTCEDLKFVVNKLNNAFQQVLVGQVPPRFDLLVIASLSRAWVPCVIPPGGVCPFRRLSLLVRARSISGVLLYLNTDSQFTRVWALVRDIVYIFLLQLVIAFFEVSEYWLAMMFLVH